MPKEYTFTPRLKLIVDHLNAVRTLDEYVHGGGLEKDMQGLSNHLQQDLNRSVFRPAGWEDLYAAGGSLYSSPKSSSPKSSGAKSTWRVVKDEPAWPVQDDEPFVNLYVPANWKKRSQFIAKLKAPSGFQHVSQSPDDEFGEEDSVFKYLPYTSYLGAEGVFDSGGLIEAFREAAKTLVDHEKAIDTVLGHMA